jgi:hypothetical protein
VGIHIGINLLTDLIISRKVIKKMKKLILYWSIFLFVFGHCSEYIKSPRKFQNEAEFAKYLESKKYRINGYGYKIGAIINSVAVSEKTDYSEDDIVTLCLESSARFIKWERTKIPNLSENTFSKCNNANIAEIGFANLRVEADELCKFVTGFKKKKFGLTLTNVNISENDIHCIAKNESIIDLAIPDKADISDNAFCRLTEKSKQMEGIQYNQAPLTIKGLNCILNFPNLKRVTFQSWKNISEKEIEKVILDYQKKYSRKIDATTLDPSGSER